MSGILLHKKLGVNARLTTCSNCGAELQDLVLLGNQNTIWVCRGCDRKVIGSSRAPGTCAACNGKDFTKVRELSESEKIPMGLCASCRTAQDAVTAEAKKGGVLWRCKDCGSSGAFKAGSEPAKYFRELLKKPDPKQVVGVEFNRDQCPVCSGELAETGPKPL